MSLYSQLFEFQRHIVDEFKDRDSYGLFLDMGLGKTITSLAFAEINKCTKVIIITINAKAIEDETIKDSWFGWLKQSDIQYKFHHKWTKDTFDLHKNEALLINYESLFSRKKSAKSGIQLSDKVNDFIVSAAKHNVAIIVDESHKMKDLQSKQTKAIFQLKKMLKLFANKVYTYLLTGTPFTQGYIDLYTQLKMLGYNDTKTSFIDQYCVRANIPGLLGWQQPIAGYKNLEDLYRTIHRYAITIKSEDVINLPEQIFVKHSSKQSLQFSLFTYEKSHCKYIAQELRNRQLSDVDYLEDKKVNNPFFRNIAYPELKWIADTTGVFWLRARQLSIGFQGNAEEAQWFNSNRYNNIKEFLYEHEDNYIIFYNFTPELIVLYDICEKLGYNIDVFCGAIKSLDFYYNYCSMNEENKLTNKKNVILANFGSGSTGMNWQQYNKVIIASVPLYKDYAQAIKRVHRPGQKETVVYHTFYEDNWLDSSMLKALDEKTQYSEDMFASDLERLKRLSEDFN